MLGQTEAETVTNEDLASVKVALSISNPREDDLVNALVLIHGKLFARRRRTSDVFARLKHRTDP
jgi:hypothetical protein